VTFKFSVTVRVGLQDHGQQPLNVVSAGITLEMRSSYKEPSDKFFGKSGSVQVFGKEDNK
jgi:hypothetical protein